MTRRPLLAVAAAAPVRVVPVSEYSWCVVHGSICDDEPEEPAGRGQSPLCMAAVVLRAFPGPHQHTVAGCSLVGLYRAEIVGVEEAGTSDGRNGREPVASSSTPAPSEPFELIPGVFQLDPTRLDIGPSTPPDMLAAVLARAAETGTVIRCHAPSFDLLHRIALAGHDLQLRPVFDLLPDGDLANVTVHPADLTVPA